MGPLTFSTSNVGPPFPDVALQVCTTVFLLANPVKNLDLYCSFTMQSLLAKPPPLSDCPLPRRARILFITTYTFYIHPQCHGCLAISYAHGGFSFMNSLSIRIRTVRCPGAICFTSPPHSLSSPSTFNQMVMDYLQKWSLKANCNLGGLVPTLSNLFPSGMGFVVFASFSPPV